MKLLFRFFFSSAKGPASILFIRLAVGLIFFTQGILKYIDPNMGVIRFTRIGFPHPYFTAHFVETFEIVCGPLVLLGLGTRAAAVPLLIVIATAIATTTVPELFRANQGVWYMVSDARTDLAMLCSLLFFACRGRRSVVFGCTAWPRKAFGDNPMKDLAESTGQFLKTNTSHRWNSRSLPWGGTGAPDS